MDLLNIMLLLEYIALNKGIIKAQGYHILMEQRDGQFLSAITFSGTLEQIHWY